MEPRKLNVLFLCTGNTSRSIIAEALLNAIGGERFHGYSAGSFPKGMVNPYALDLLHRNRLPVEGLRSKSWDEFSGPGAPPLDFVFTVCDQAAGEVCPVWPGQPMSAHWGIADPAAVEGTEEQKRRAFFTTYNQLHHRLSIFVNLPFGKLDRMSLQNQLDAIGKETTAAA